MIMAGPASVHREESNSLHVMENKLSMDRIKCNERIAVPQIVKTICVIYLILVNSHCLKISVF